MQKIRFLKKCDGNKKNSITHISDKKAEELMMKGIVEIINECNYSKGIQKLSEINFKKPELILEIHKEISKTHLFDDDIKLLGFLTCSTAYLKNHKHHKSLAIKGDRSVGKDSLMGTVSSHYPDKDVLFLTSGTTAAIEDSINEYKIIICSEINLQDVKGANVHLVEIIKQLTEGGTSVLKKSQEGNRWVTQLTKQEQKTFLYSTTQSADDEELNTRFIVGSVQADKNKISSVNKNTIKEFSGLIDISSESWIKFGIEHLFDSDEVIFDFLDKLPEDFFDNSDPRSMRDVKRFFSIAAGVSWLYQLQRKRDSKNRIIGEPMDFLIAMIIASDFFNYTYQGLGDQRLQRFIDEMNNYLKEQKHGGLLVNRNIFPRHEIQKRLDVSLNTIKGYVKGCQDLSIIRFYKVEGNEVFYERCQRGVKRVLIRYQWFDIFKRLEGVNINNNIMKILNNLYKICKNSFSSVIPEEIDTLKLTPSPQNIQLAPEWNENENN